MKKTVRRIAVSGSALVAVLLAGGARLALALVDTVGVLPPLPSSCMPLS